MTSAGMPVRARSGVQTNPNRFTLIELLVGVSVLGIVAAVVTMSVGAFTALTQKQAAATEKRTVQAAMDAMIAEQKVDGTAACGGSRFQGPRGTGVAGAKSTNDMETFPIDRKYAASGSGTLVALYPHYLRQSKTRGSYHCVVERNPDRGTRQDAGVIEQDRYSSP